MSKFNVVKPVKDPVTELIVEPGASIDLTESQAKYLLLQGKIERPAAKTKPKS